MADRPVLRKAVVLAALTAMAAAGWTGAVLLLMMKAAPAASSFECLVLEAESATTLEPPMVKGAEKPDVCSKGAYIEIPLQEPRGTDKVNGRALIPFEIKTPGSYFLHARCWWFDGCGNSFGITVDSHPKATLTDSTEKRWHWVKLRGDPLVLLAGKHTLVISNSEDGAKVDQVLLTNEPDYVPQDIE